LSSSNEAWKEALKIANIKFESLKGESFQALLLLSQSREYQSHSKVNIQGTNFEQSLYLNQRAETEVAVRLYLYRRGTLGINECWEAGFIINQVGIIRSIEDEELWQLEAGSWNS
jgi:hypothetical protein